LQSKNKEFDSESGLVLIKIFYNAEPERELKNPMIMKSKTRLDKPIIYCCHFGFIFTFVEQSLIFVTHD